MVESTDLTVLIGIVVAIDAVVFAIAIGQWTAPRHDGPWPYHHPVAVLPLDLFDWTKARQRRADYHAVDNGVSNVQAANVAASDSEGAAKIYRGHKHNVGLTTMLERRGLDSECEVHAAPLSAILKPEEWPS